MDEMQYQRTFPPGFSAFPVTPVGGRDDDPVRRAVYDNIMGKLPKSKPKVAIQCDLCSIGFTTEIPYQMHLNGIRHAKKVKSLELKQVFEEDGLDSLVDGDSSNMTCKLCGVSVNSCQQMQLHLLGTKHKSKIARKRTANESNLTDEGASSESLESLPPPAKKSLYFSCETCGRSLNSQQQLDQHMSSIKHRNKVERKANPNKKALVGMYKRKLGLGYTGGQGYRCHEQDFASTCIPLSGSFVSGEAL